MKNTKIEIYNNAKKLFSENGFKDTSVATITKLSGIGVGTFYNFYSSKEQLFMEIFFNENRSLKREVIESIDINADPISVCKLAIQKLFFGMRKSPILCEWYNRDIFHKILEKIHQDNTESNSEDFFYSFFKELIVKWQNDGSIRTDIKSDIILSVFNALSFIDLHKEEVGEEYFSVTMDYLVEFIVMGISNKSDFSSISYKLQ